MATRTIVLTLACAASLAAGAAASAGPAALTLSAASHKAHPAARERDASGQIACTKYGCMRIPPNCHPTAAFYWNGTPTGYDAISCH
jgi:hypothetical protein